MDLVLAANKTIAIVRFGICVWLQQFYRQCWDFGLAATMPVYLGFVFGCNNAIVRFWISDLGLAATMQESDLEFGFGCNSAVVSFFFNFGLAATMSDLGFAFLAATMP